MISGVLFDLDGTLADTAPDLADALNETLKSFGKQPLAFDVIRPVVSHGGIAMIKLGFDIGPEDQSYQSIRQQFLQTYLDNIANKTTLFPGMEMLLTEIENRKLPWGVVTNKPGWLTNPLMEALNLTKRAATIVSGDTVAKAKPHPDPIFFGCKQAGLDPKNCLYVGDAERDIQAGKAAGMRTVAALFGYILDHENPIDWQADIYINNPEELIDYL